MKIKILVFAILLAVGSSSMAFANEGPALTVVNQKGSDIFKVIYKGGTTGRVRLNIIDQQGKTIHTEVLAGLHGFILPVNFKSLQSGNYTIQLTDNTGKYQEKVSYLPSSQRKSIHVTKLVHEEGKYLLAVADAENETIRIRIFDEEQRLVHDESKVLSGDFAQVYTIQNSRGSYTFEVGDDAGNRKYFDF